MKLTMNAQRMRRLAAMMILMIPAGLDGTALLAQSSRPHEQANLKVVMDWWREVVFAHHVELAAKYMAEDCVQHDPNVPSGRAAFVEMFGKRPVQPIPDALPHPPVKAFAKGDYVALVWEHEDKDPADSSKTYAFNTFDVMRIQDGKIQEHWDSSAKDPSSTAILAPASSPTDAPELKLTPEEQKNQEIAFIEFHDMLQYGHLELAERYMAPGYIQHNPNVPQGRDGFLAYMSARKPEPIKPEWKNKPVLVITSGDMVLLMFDRTAPDPADPSKKYTYNGFDMVRVDDGLIQEHWDAAKKTPPAPAKP